MTTLGTKSIAVALALSLGLVAMPAATALLGLTAQPTEILVGFHGSIDRTLLSLAGVSVLRTLDEIGVVHGSTLDPLGATRLLSVSPLVAFVESNDATAASGAWDGVRYSASSWDASSWDGASWDGASWDGSSWDASSWDGASWDASSWDGASWDGASWDGASWDASSWDASSWDALAMDPGFPAQWGLGAGGFAKAWDVTRGHRAVGVCVLDTGIDTSHPDLAGVVATSYDARLGKKAPGDDVGHGTHVAGIIAALGGNGIGVTGAVREVLHNVKVMGPSGGRDADLAAGLDRCADVGARVATMSLHLDKHSPTVARAVAKAQERGLLLVAASGNDGSSSVRYPAAYPGVLAVGAVTPSAEAAPFSNGGPRLDLVAPGTRIASTIPGGYAMGSGTSQAAPFVAAAAALALDVRPDLTASEVRGLLLESARDLGPAGRDDRTGAGALDAGDALRRALAAP